MATAEPEIPIREVRLRDLKAGTDPVLIVARVVQATRRDITRRTDGGRRPVLSGLLSDGTATVRFTWWDPPPGGVERGTVLRAAPVSVREFQGRPEVSFSWRTRVEPASEAELPKVSPEEFPLRSVGELKQRDEGFRLEARLVRIQPKTVTVGQEQRQLHEGILADATGAIAFTAWQDFSLKPGEALRITGAYVRGFRGRPQLTLDDRSRVDRIDGKGLPATEAILESSPHSLAEVESAGGSDLARVEGLVLGLMPPSGVVYRCPVCRRSVSKGLCRVHGAVTGEADLRARLVLDDGTSTATVNLGRTDTETLWRRSLSEALDRLRNLPDATLLEEELFETLFGRRLRITGRATVDDFGLSISPETVAEVAADPDRRGKELRRRLRESAP